MNLKLFAAIILSITATLSAQAVSHSIETAPVALQNSSGPTVPYYVEYRFRNILIIFEGNIHPEDEPAIKALQTEYLESHIILHARGNEYKLYQFQSELNSLGVTVKRLRDNPNIPSSNAQHYHNPQLQHHSFDE